MSFHSSELSSHIISAGFKDARSRCQDADGPPWQQTLSPASRTRRPAMKFQSGMFSQRRISKLLAAAMLAALALGGSSFAQQTQNQQGRAPQGSGQQTGGQQTA